jgi:hypothetical protein
MLLRWVEANGFLSFGKPVRLDVGTGLTVVTGPNGAGKSNLARCLDLARAAVGPAGNDSVTERLNLYKDAGYEGAPSFTVRLGIELDQQWEHDLVLVFARACFTSGPASGRSPKINPEALDKKAQLWLTADSLAPLWSATLVINYFATAQPPWTVAWEFAHAGQPWHVALRGSDAGELQPGTAEQPEPGPSRWSFTDWLQRDRPEQGDVALDIQAAMQKTRDTVTFTVRSLAPHPYQRSSGNQAGLDTGELSPARCGPGG